MASSKVATFPRLAHDWLVHELDMQLHRRAGVIASGSGEVGTGLVLGKNTSTGKYHPIDFAATDGTEQAAAICINRTDASSTDKETAVLTGHAQIVPNQLVWPVGVTTEQKTAALAQLEALGIVSHQR